jgi:hypothetical protein
VEGSRRAYGTGAANDRQAAKAVSNSSIHRIPRKDLGPVAVQNSDGARTHEGNPGKNLRCFQLRATGIGLMVDDPAQDFRLIAAAPAEDVYEINHALEFDPRGLLASIGILGGAGIRLTTSIRRFGKFRQIPRMADAAAAHYGAPRLEHFPIQLNRKVL